MGLTAKRRLLILAEQPICSYSQARPTKRIPTVSRYSTGGHQGISCHGPGLINAAGALTSVIKVDFRL